MKTAEVAIEHILTGLLALCAFALPLFSGNNYLEHLLTKESALVGVLGLAYLSGVVFDKLADTILSPIEHYFRLKLASGAEQKAAGAKGRRDPFPQDLLEFSLRGEKNGRADWMDSLRSRMRTCRGLSVLGAPAAMGIAIFHYCRGSRAVLMNWPHWGVALNLILIVLAIAIISRLKQSRTFEVGETRVMSKAKWQILFGCWSYFLMLINSVTTVVVLAALPRTTRAGFVIVVCSALAIWLPLWAWCRITRTYMSFVLRQLPNLGPEEPASLPVKVPTQ